MNEDNFTGIDAQPGRRAFSIPNGWALDKAVQVDDAAPGFLARLSRARLAWRQAVWAALASEAHTSAEFAFRCSGDCQMLDAPTPRLMSAFGLIAPGMTARELTEGSYGACPEGWLGALRKIQGQTFRSPESYAVLFRLYSSDDPIDRKRRAALDQLSVLDEHLLFTVLALNDPAFMVPAILRKISGPEGVRRFNENVAFVRKCCSWIADSDIRDAIVHERDLRGQPWLLSLMARADKLIPEHHPCDGDPDFQRFPIGAAGKIGREFRNCLHPTRMLPQAASGVWAMVLWRAERLLLETRMLDTGDWQVRRIHGFANSEVERDLVLKTRDKVARVGVHFPIAADPPVDLDGFASSFGGWDRRIAAPFDFGTNDGLSGAICFVQNLGWIDV